MVGAHAKLLSIGEMPLDLERARQALEALENAVKGENPDALETLIEQASIARAQWRMNAIRPQG